MKWVQGSPTKDKKKRKFVGGWTYAELQKVWRMGRREAKLEGWKRYTFKEFRDQMLTLIP